MGRVRGAVLDRPGGQTYRIDESTNRVTAGTGDYFRPDRPGLDVFAMLGLARPATQVLSETTPAERIDFSGQAVDVYRIDAAERDGTPRVVEAEADGATGKLLRVRTLARLQNGALQALVTLVVLAEGQPVPEEKFVVKPTLAEDGRVGKFAEVQGLVSRKPVLGSRWMPVRPNGLLMPGDWVRADARGANAATLRLLPKAEVIVGPGGLVELIKPNQVRLHEGEAEVAPAKGTPIELLGPGTTKVAVTERGFYRVQKEQIAKVEKEAVWLKGFKGTSANESLGSLVAQVDGRNTPLSVGVHKVSVDIRDQIARTTIEETFVNHTNSQLEGVFHFPLPQDASISGFAMWIGDQMIEADVVEKQRAREIYEEILRERRDPGLLEWTGGNVFKARVWPIFANSEKRIRVTYTQVLPLKGNAYRYSYALQSEMLQLNPLKELTLDVKVQSAAPLKAVSSPTHTARLDKAEHAAHVEFSAQQHTPTRDFEVVVEVAEKAPAVAVVPHRRGADGYFLVQLSTPAVEREQAASDGPLDVLLVCDTSASIDPAQRAAQATLANAVLEALTPKDTFNLAACDVNADWTFDKPQPATAENVQKARAVLNGRVSLGWTDLDRAFGATLKQCGPGTQVIYLGDGIATTRDANPQAFAARLKAAYATSRTTATFHAVALGSSFESGVLKAIGSLGGGSFRRVSSEQGPVAVALELLDEITRPPVRDLRVEFKGWKTARVYPEVLANLVPGTQQILIGRYLPEGKSQYGEVSVSGIQNGKPIRYTAAATLPDEEAGNSFLPRLWARMHLDKLLDQPQSPAVKDDVIALSEEFGIITPYTSFLVLESDADRERFKVKRRLQMRDGEQFFAKGRDAAEYELARHQMMRAGTWRIGLRRDVLSLLGTLGRDVRSLPPGQHQYSFGGGGLGGAPGRSSAGVSIDSLSELSDFDGLERAERSKYRDAEDFVVAGSHGDRLELGQSFGVDKKLGEIDEPLEAKEAFKEDAAERLFAVDEGTFGRLAAAKPQGLDSFESFSGIDDNSPWGGRAVSDSRGRRDAGLKANAAYAVSGRLQRGRYESERRFDGLFPTIPEPAKPSLVKPSDWPQEARDLARLVARGDDLAKIAGGVRIDRQVDAFDPRDGATTSRELRQELYAPTTWAVRAGHEGGQTSIEWCDGKECGTFGTAFRLGRVRAATPADLRDTPLQFDDGVQTPLDESYRHMKAAVEKVDGKPVLVDCQLFERAVAIYGEVIPLHQRSHASRGVGTGTLSRYYQRLSVAHTGLNKPLDALDAAGGAIVSWGPNVNGRAEALTSLNDVLKAAQSLDAIVAHLDNQLAETGLVNPVVRKAVGRAYMERAKYAPAIAQLQIALSGQANDAETLQFLVECFDKLNNPDGAVAQMILALQLNRRDIKRYEALGNRLEGLDRGAEAERAYTSIVEVLPNESEGHALLAEIRQKQNRWTDALVHWEQVAQIRALEPAGLLGVAGVHLHEKQWDKLAETITKLKARPWPPHFGDAPHRIAEFEQQLRDAKR